MFRDRDGLYGAKGGEIDLSGDRRVRRGQIEGIKKIKHCSELVKKCQKQIDNPRAKADLKGINQFLKADHNEQIAELNLKNASFTPFEVEMLKNRIYHARKLEKRLPPKWSKEYAHFIRMGGNPNVGREFFCTPSVSEHGEDNSPSPTRIIRDPSLRDVKSYKLQQMKIEESNFKGSSNEPSGFVVGSRVTFDG